MDNSLIAVLTVLPNISLIAILCLTNKFWSGFIAQHPSWSWVPVFYRNLRRKMKNDHRYEISAEQKLDPLSIFDLIGRSTVQGILQYTYDQHKVSLLETAVAVVARYPEIWHLLPDTDRTATMKDLIGRHLRKTGRFDLMQQIPDGKITHWETDLLRRPYGYLSISRPLSLSSLDENYQLLFAQHSDLMIILDIRDQGNRYRLPNTDHSQGHILLALSFPSYEYADLWLVRSATTLAGLQWYFRTIPGNKFPHISNYKAALRSGHCDLVSYIIECNIAQHLERRNQIIDDLQLQQDGAYDLGRNLIHGRYEVLEYMEHHYNLGLTFFVDRTSNSCRLWMTLLAVIKKKHLRELQVLLTLRPEQYRYCEVLLFRGRCHCHKHYEEYLRQGQSWDDVLSLGNWALCRAAWHQGKGNGPHSFPPGPRSPWKFLVQKLTPTAHTQMLAALKIKEL